eukprot:TRINITY_DN66807_c0_g1_i1.p1 TRINITY_DN66807_c0_g1~~TRINITY_DN66807_c0_g1_i1.p1  ORF type:complete len:208 (+),score=57.14 TRINITY_DN66807_c0_g1_i1:248-871(+)
MVSSLQVGAGLLVVCLAQVASANLNVSRTVSNAETGFTANVTLSSGCETADAFGSNNCSLDWGKQYILSVAAKAPGPIEAGARITGDLQLDDLLPLAIDCPACGGTCEFDVPIVKQHVSQKMPDCPLFADGSYTFTKEFTLPSQSPYSLTLNIVGPLTVKDKDGNVLMVVDMVLQIGEEVTPAPSPPPGEPGFAFNLRSTLRATRRV